MVSSNETPIKNHSKCVKSIGWDYIHDPQGIINCSRSKTSISSIHVHYVSYLIRPNGREQLFVVLNSHLPLTVIMLESISTPTINIWNPFRCNMQPLRPFSNGCQSRFLKLWAWNNDTRAKWSVPCWIWFKAIITFWGIGIWICQLIVTTIVRRFLPNSNVILFVVQFEAHRS